jgi:hypothetical protein
MATQRKQHSILWYIFWPLAIFVAEDNALWKFMPGFMKVAHNVLVLLAAAWLCLAIWIGKIMYEGGVWAYDSLMGIPGHSQIVQPVNLNQ